MNRWCSLGLHKWLELDDGSFEAKLHPMRECQRPDCKRVQGYDWNNHRWANFRLAKEVADIKERRTAVIAELSK